MTDRPVIRAWKIMRFIFSVSFIVAILALLNWMPELIQKQRLKQYPSVEAARKELNLGNLNLPTYIPERLNLAWPPSEVYAQELPFKAFIMNFAFQGKKEIGLIIRQTESKAPYTLDPSIKIRETAKGGGIDIRDRKAELVSAVCDLNTPCNRLQWDEGGITITLIGKCPAQELIKIATSMLPGI